MTIALKANAKVNLFLRVVGKRADGYHDIESVFTSIGLADELTIAATGDDDLEVIVEGARLDPEHNTVRDAVARLAAVGGPSEGIAIELRKSVPVGAGLGGGSADAAAALVGLNRLWDLGLSTDALRAVALEVGSDVPHGIEGGPALVSGRGEHVARLSATGTIWLVLGLSDSPLATADVYAKWDETRTSTLISNEVEIRPEMRSELMVAALAAGDPAVIAAALHNDLETAAFSLRPELPEKKEAMVAAGALGALMSGSGPTIFGVAVDEAAAQATASRLAETFDRVEVVPTRPSCVEFEATP